MNCYYMTLYAFYCVYSHSNTFETYSVKLNNKDFLYFTTLYWTCVGLPLPVAVRSYNPEVAHKTDIISETDNIIYGGHLRLSLFSLLATST